MLWRGQNFVDLQGLADRPFPLTPSMSRSGGTDRVCQGRAKRALTPKPEIARVFGKNVAVYGVRKVWRPMTREQFALLQHSYRGAVMGTEASRVFRRRFHLSHATISRFSQAA